MILKLDYDRYHIVPTRGQMVARLRRAGYSAVSIKRCKSPSGTGIHVRVVLKQEPVSPFEVVALQAILGSDPIREACNLVRARAVVKMQDPFWRKRWNVLYSKDPANG